MAEEPQAAEAFTQASVNESSVASAKEDGAVSTTQVYEVAFHLVSGVGEEGVGNAVEKIRAVLTAQSAEVISERFPTKFTLAYVIERSVAGKREKHGESFLGWIKFAVEPVGVEALAEALRGMSEVLRYLIVETVREEPQAPRRALYTSDRLEGQTLEKKSATEEGGQVSEEELDKSIEALVN